MQTLELDPAVPYIVGPGPITVVLVGCGGTGSHIAQSLARTAAHLRGTPKALNLVFVDGDTVEERNVGRQLFSHADIGQNKATVLAERFNRVFGLAIGALPQMATKTNLNSLMQGRTRGTPVILVGAVDTSAARQLLADYMTKSAISWLDCGNHEHGGQVLFGTTSKVEELHGAIQLNLCTTLPAPHLVAPSLLNKTPRRRGNCAVDMENNLQSLMVNQQMAAIAATYLHALIVERRLTVYETIVDLGTLSMRSTPITARNLAAVCGAEPMYITGKKAAKPQRSAA